MTSTYKLKSCLVVLVGLLAAQQVVAVQRDSLRKVSVREVEADLQATLSTLLRGTSASSNRRFELIEAKTWQTFQALPKNSAGRLAPPAVRHIVHNYFAREHGWQIKGLEPHGMQLNVSQIHDVNILQDKAPLLVEGLLEARQADRGLAFNDIVTMVAVLERMMFDESVTLLQAAYRLNGLAEEDEISKDMLHVVLQSYLLLFGQGVHAKLFDIDNHQSLVQSHGVWEVAEFEHDTVLNYEFANRHRANPFKARQYSFQNAIDIMEELAQKYGKWQNSECRDMRAHLVELDPEGLGSVPLGLFYAQPIGSAYTFHESADYLRSVGALDETTPGNPKVYIANYMSGPSNCIASSSYYSVCCLSECDDMLADLEHHVSAPTASPEKLLASIAKVFDAKLPSGMPDRLQAIAARHGGEVPLHGRLFAQWLHFAFPSQCPYPSVVKSATALIATEWQDGQSGASEEERQPHIESAVAGAEPTARDFDIDQRWSDHEVLPVHTQPTQSFFQGGLGLVLTVVRTAVQLVAVVAALRFGLAAWQGVAGTGDAKGKKNDDFALPFHV